jgi:hypothetical protein
LLWRRKTGVCDPAARNSESREEKGGEKDEEEERTCFDQKVKRGLEASEEPLGFDVADEKKTTTCFL